jgi:hypothetical protein
VKGSEFDGSVLNQERGVNENWESLVDGSLNPSVWAVNYFERLPKKFFSLVISSGETSIKFTPHR